MSNDQLHAVHFTSDELETMQAWLTVLRDQVSASEMMSKSEGMSRLGVVISKTRQAYVASLGVENENEPIGATKAPFMSPEKIADFVELLREFARQFPEGLVFADYRDGATNYREEINTAARSLERISRWQWRGKHEEDLPF